MDPRVSARRDLLRHTLATLAYRGGKAVRGASSGFSEFKAGPTSRTAGQILAHLCDLMDWGLSLAEGSQKWQESKPQSWDDDVERFHRALLAFDERLAKDAELGSPPERLFQGPVADALTHVGQIAMLRRLAGDAVKGENYHKAEITAGRLDADQAKPHREFD
jgi:hypothetical protein